MTIIDILITIAILCFMFFCWTKIVQFIKRLFSRYRKKKQIAADAASDYCLLQISPSGELTHKKFTDTENAQEHYSTAVNFCEGNGSYIALFKRAVLIDSNKERSELQ